MEAHVGQALPGVGGIELGQGNGGDSHLVGIGARQKTQPEDLEPVHGSHAVEVLIDGADQDLAPEAVDGARRLAFLEEPVEHADAVQIRAAGMFAADGQQRARDAELVRAVEAAHPQKRSGEVERRRQPAAAQDGEAASGLQKVDLLMEADQVADPQALVEIQEVDAAAQQQVLAVIDGLGGVLVRAGNGVGRGASAQERARLEEVHVETSAAQSGCRGEAGKAAAGYENRGHQQPV